MSHSGLANSYLCYSYSSYDEAFAGKLARGLEVSGHTVWFSPTETTGGEQEAERYARIEAAAYFIFVISPDSVRSETALRELTYAGQRKKQLLAVLRYPVREDHLPAPLKGCTPVDFSTEDRFKSALPLLLKQLAPRLRLDAFISYSRKDEAFVGQLDEALLAPGRRTWLDRKAIHPTEQWRKAIFSGILAADNFVVVLSPDYLRSPVCTQELEFAVQHNKRLVVLLRREVSGLPVPPPVAESNWILFREHEAFEEALGKLLEALDTDVAYVREHSRLLVRAVEWNAAKRKQNAVLRGDELKQAQQWLLAGNRGKKPAPTPLHARFIRASRKATLSRNVLIAASLALVVVILSILAVSVKERAKQKNIADARGWAGEATQLLGQPGNVVPRSLLLAARAMQHSPSPEADLALRRGLNLLPPRRATLRHHAGLTGIAFSPDSTLLATATEDSAIHVWNLVTETRLWRSPKQTGTVRLGFSPDGKYLATAADSVVRVWEAPTGRPVATMTHRKRIGTFSFGPQSDYLLTGGYDGRASLWRIPGGSQVWSHPHRKPVVLSAFSPDGRQVATGGFDTTVVIREVTTGRSRHRLPHHLSVTSLASSADGKYVLTATGDQVVVWDAKSGRCRRVLSHPPAVNTLAATPEGNYVATAGVDRIVRVWDFTTGAEITRTAPPGGHIEWLSFSPDGSRIAGSSLDNTVYVWEAETGREVYRLGHDREVKAAAFGAGGKYLVTAATDPFARVWSLERSFDVLVRDRLAAEAVAFSPDGKYLAAIQGLTIGVRETTGGRLVWRKQYPGYPKSINFNAPGDRMAVINTVDSALAGRTASALAVVETASGRELFRREQPVDFVSAAFSPGNRFLVTAQADGTVALRDVRRDSLLWQRSVTGNIVSVLFSPDGRRVWVAGDSLVGLDAAGGERFWLRRPEEAAQVAVLSPDGQWLAVAGSDGPVYLYRPGTREPVVRFAGEDGTVLHLQLGKDSRSLASVTTNGTAVVWDVGERKPVTTLKTEEMLSPVAFSPAGTYLALGTDPLARVWRLPGGTEEIRIPHANFVKSIAFSPDERRLATADADGTIRISWLRPADLIEAACERLLDNIPAEERAEYGGSGELDTVCPGDEGKAQRVAERGRKRSDE